MPILPLMLAAAAAHASPERTDEYQSYRRCLSGTVRDAARMQVIPEDLLVQLQDACPKERADFAAMMGRRSPQGPGVGSTQDPSVVTAWTDPLLVRAVRRYAIHYTTGKWIRE